MICHNCNQDSEWIYLGTDRKEEVVCKGNIKYWEESIYKNKYMCCCCREETINIDRKIKRIIE